MGYPVVFFDKAWYSMIVIVRCGPAGRPCVCGGRREDLDEAPESCPAAPAAGGPGGPRPGGGGGLGRNSGRGSGLSQSPAPDRRRPGHLYHRPGGGGGHPVPLRRDLRPLPRVRPAPPALGPHRPRLRAVGLPGRGGLPPRVHRPVRPAGGPAGDGGAPLPGGNGHRRDLRLLPRGAARLGAGLAAPPGRGGSAADLLPLRR